MRRSEFGRITRRGAVRRMVAGSAGLACVVKPGAAAQSAPADKAAVIERVANGSEIWQVTSGRFDPSNIYCEVPYCSGDSRYFVYARKNLKASDANHTDLMVVELGVWKQHRLDTSTGIRGLAISHDGVLTYHKAAPGGTTALMRADLSEGKPKEVHRIQSRWLNSLGTVSADGRYYACGKRIDEKYTMFGILLIDLKIGRETIIDRDRFILNPHPQFEPGESRHLMIQHNRGGTYAPDGTLERLVGPEGATLYLLSVPDGKRTTLQVGTPYTTPVTGHEAWIGTTKEMLLSVAASGDFAPEKGNLLGIRSGQPARVVARGYRFNHVGASRCGRFFTGDDWRDPYRIILGSVQSGRTAVLCASKTKPGRSQNTHPHPYLTPDGKWVIFNSNRTGHPQVYAASVPEDLLARIAEA